MILLSAFIDLRAAFTVLRAVHSQKARYAVVGSKLLRMDS